MKDWIMDNKKIIFVDERTDTLWIGTRQEIVQSVQWNVWELSFILLMKVRLFGFM